MIWERDVGQQSQPSRGRGRYPGLRMATKTKSLLPQVRELSEKEWEQLADEKARQYFGIDAAEFARRLESGEMDIDDDPDVMRVAMLLRPIAE